MVPVSSLIFDLDGTLIDSSEDISNSVNYTLAQLGLPKKTKQDVQGYIGDGMKVLLMKATGQKQANLIKEAIEIFRPHYLEHCTDNTSLYSGAKDVLDYFESKKMALVSNKPVEMVLKTLDCLGINAYFPIILGAESTKEKKPHPEPLLKSLDLMRVSPRSCLMVGDGITDIQAGKSAGILTCAVTYGYKSRQQLEQCKPDFMIDRINQLKQIVE